MTYIQWMLDALPLEKLTGCRIEAARRQLRARNPLRTATGRMLRIRDRQGPFRNQVRRRDRRLQSRHTMGNLRRTLKRGQHNEKIDSCGRRRCDPDLLRTETRCRLAFQRQRPERMDRRARGDSTLHPSTEFTVEDGAIFALGKASATSEPKYRTPTIGSMPNGAGPIRRPTAASSCTSSATASGRTATNASYGTAKPGDLIHSSGTESAELRAHSTLISTPETRALDGETGRRMEHGRDRLLGQHGSPCTSTASFRTGSPVRRNRQGFIGLQSEGGPVQFRNIILTPLDCRGSRTLPPGVGITLGK